MSGVRHHLTREQAELLASDCLQPSDRRRAVRHLLSRCGQCAALVREVIAVTPPDSAEYAEILRRLELSAMVAQQDVLEERIYAEQTWSRILSSLEAGQRLRVIRDNEGLHTWGILALLLEHAKKSIRESPFEAADLAHAAIFIGDLLPVSRYGEERIFDFKGAAYAALGNVKRLIGDFAGAKEALAHSGELLEKGTGDPYEKANLISMRASLQTDLGFLEEAAQMLGEAIELARRVKDTRLEARLRIQQSSSIGWIDPTSGLDLAGLGLLLLRGHVAEDEHLLLGAVHLTAFWSNELGCTADARATLESFRSLYQKFPDPWTQGRLLLLDALICRNEGRQEESERLLRKLVDVYSEHQMEFDLALAILEWAESLVLCGKYDEAEKVMVEVYPLIGTWSINVEVLRSWHIMGEAIRGKAVNASSFRELSMTLRRKWYRRE